MKAPPYKVGELARRTGVSVRTLHHYDERGLLSPSHRSDSGYRLYGAADVVRLQQIRSLRTLGFSLGEIGDFLKSPGVTPERVLGLHIAHLDEQIERQRSLRDRLQGIAGRYGSDETIPTEEFLKIIEETTMLDRYYTPEQMAELKQRKEALGEERIRQVEGEWPELMRQVQEAMDRGTDPSDAGVQSLATRWMELVREFTGGNPGIAASAQKMYQEETTVAGMDTGPMRQMMEYVGKALAAKKEE